LNAKEFTRQRNEEHEQQKFYQAFVSCYPLLSFVRASQKYIRFYQGYNEPEVFFQLFYGKYFDEHFVFS